MENYSKGKNVEDPLNRKDVPFDNLPENFLWMQVSGSNKIRNLLEHALSCLDTEKVVVWSGSGPGLQKAISCVEIMKRKLPMHQVNRISYRTVEEHWTPQLEGLEPLVVKRDIPIIHILLSKEPLDSTQLGYQPPLEPAGEKKPTNRRHMADASKGRPGKRPQHERNQRSEKLKQCTRRDIE